MNVYISISLVSPTFSNFIAIYYPLTTILVKKLQVCTAPLPHPIHATFLKPVLNQHAKGEISCTFIPRYGKQKTHLAKLKVPDTHIQTLTIPFLTPRNV